MMATPASVVFSGSRAVGVMSASFRKRFMMRGSFIYGIYGIFTYIYHKM